MIVDDLNAALHHTKSQRTNARRRQLQEVLAEGYFHCIDNDSITYERNDCEEKLN